MVGVSWETRGSTSVLGHYCNIDPSMNRCSALCKWRTRPLSYCCSAHPCVVRVKYDGSRRPSLCSSPLARPMQASSTAARVGCRFLPPYTTRAACEVSGWRQQSRNMLFYARHTNTYCMINARSVQQRVRQPVCRGAPCPNGSPVQLAARRWGKGREGGRKKTRTQYYK